MSGVYGGQISVSLGDVLHFAFSNRGAIGTSDALNSWPSDPTFYQVYQRDGTLITTGDSGGTAGPGSTSTRPITEMDATNYPDLFQSSTTAPYTLVVGDFPVGSTGYILVHNTALTLFQVIDFRVNRETAIAVSTSFIDTTEPTDSTLEANPNTMLGRLWTVEKNQRDVLMPRLKRILGHMGENQICDAFVYDDDGNITECRVRIFQDITSRDAANIWSDTINDADPAASLEAGEIARYTVNVSNLLPRNLRTVYQQEISTEATDSSFGDLGSAGTSIL